MFCKHCGGKIKDNDRFCPKCGARIEEDDSADVADESSGNTKKNISLISKIILFIENNSVLLSLCISLLTFFVPLQITKKKVILGIDLILFFKIKSWWGDQAILALIVGLCLFIPTIFFVVYTLVILKKEKSDSKNKRLHKIIIFNCVLSILYFVFGLVTLFLCDSSWKPWTLSFIPLILQTPVFLVYIIKMRKTTDYTEVGNFKKNKLNRIFIISISVILCLSFTLYGFVNYNNSNNDSDYNPSNGGTTGDYDDTVSKYLGLSLNVTQIKKSGSYTYVYCSIKNISALYGNATMYRYVQVKAVFKDRYC